MERDEASAIFTCPKCGEEMLVALTKKGRKELADHINKFSRAQRSPGASKPARTE